MCLLSFILYETDPEQRRSQLRPVRGRQLSHFCYYDITIILKGPIALDIYAPHNNVQIAAQRAGLLSACSLGLNYSRSYLFGSRLWMLDLMLPVLYVPVNILGSAMFRPLQLKYILFSVVLPTKVETML
jgi:hypothetical protein